MRSTLLPHKKYTLLHRWSVFVRLFVQLAHLSSNCQAPKEVERKQTNVNDGGKQILGDKPSHYFPVDNTYQLPRLTHHIIVKFKSDQFSWQKVIRWLQKHETSRQLTIDRSDFSGLRDILLQMVSYANIATNDHGNDDDDDDKVMMLAMVSLECANTDRPTVLHANCIVSPHTQQAFGFNVSFLPHVGMLNWCTNTVRKEFTMLECSIHVPSK